MRTKNKWLGDIKNFDESKLHYIYLMTDIHKKIKHLNHTMIVWAEDNKYKNRRNDDYIIPPRTFYNELRGDVIVEWKDDMKFVTKLDRLLSDGKSLTKKELIYCNRLYEFYSGIYE